MRVYIIVGVFLILSNLSSFGQDSTAIVKRTYLQGGFTLQFPLGERASESVSIIRETKNGLLVGLRCYGRSFQDPDYPDRGGILGGRIIWHVVNEFNFSIGKVKAFNEYLGFNISTGPSFVNYIKPVNIRLRPSGGFFNLFTNYDYDKKHYNMLGWSIRFDTNFYFFRAFGISLGGLYNYNRLVPNGGLSVNFLLGKLKDKNKDLN